MSGVSYNAGVNNGGGVPSISSGLFSKIPAPGYPGRIYIATDQKIMYQDSGTAWVDILDGTGGGSGTITSVNGTANQITAITDAGGNVVLSFPTNTIITGNTTANAFVKPGGTAGQFLKADGSVDSNAYALAAALANYLLLTGGTLTGNLGIGTSLLNKPYTGERIALNNPEIILENTLTTTADEKLTYIEVNNGAFVIGFLSDLNIKYPILQINRFSFAANGTTLLSTLNTYGYTGGYFQKNGGLPSQYLMADGSVTTGGPVGGNIVASNDFVNIGALTTNIITYVVPAGSDRSFYVSGYFEILSAAGAGIVIDFSVTYTTPNGTVVSRDFFDGGGINPPVGNTGVVSNYQVMGEIRAKTGTGITAVFQASGTVTSISYNAGGTLILIR